jgi:hypothetical protein
MVGINKIGFSDLNYLGQFCGGLRNYSSRLLWNDGNIGQWTLVLPQYKNWICNSKLVNKYFVQGHDTSYEMVKSKDYHLQVMSDF